MNLKSRGTVAVTATLLALATFIAACTPTPAPGAPPGLPQDWQFRPSQVWIEEANDCVPDLGSGCLIGSSNVDEAYILNVAFRVKLGQANSAQAWVAGSRNNAKALAEGQTATLHDPTNNKAVWRDVYALDLFDLANSASRLEIFGTYVWAMEADTVGVAGAASDVASVLKDALNATVAASSAQFDTNLILDIIFDNLGNAFTLLLANIPLLGLGDDAMGGGIYVGIGAVDVLAGIIDDAIGGFSIPSFDIPVLELPPDIQQSGIFTMGGIRTFNGEVFDNDGCLIEQCGRHRYNFVAEGESLS